MFYIFLTGAIFGALCALYILTLIKDKNKDDDKVAGVYIYLNFLLLNKEEAVADTVEAKLTSRFGNSTRVKNFASRIGKFAAGRVPDSALTDKIGGIIVSMVPVKLSQMGIHGECKIVFEKSSYFVAQIKIVSVDTSTLIMKSAGKAKLGKFESLMNMVGTASVKETVENSFVHMIAGKLSDVLPTKLKDVFAAKGLDVIVAANTESDQAKYMFKMIENISMNSHKEDKADASDSKSELSQ